MARRPLFCDAMASLTGVRSASLNRRWAALLAVLLLPPFASADRSSQARPTVSVSYQLAVDSWPVRGEPLEVCLGDTLFVSVAIERTAIVTGLPTPIDPAVEHIGGGEIRVESEAPQIVTVATEQEVIRRDESIAVFDVQGVGIGAGWLAITALSTGDERPDFRPVVTGLDVVVRVVQCWRAYASGLADQFSDDEVCATTSFPLSGTHSVVSSTFKANFTPTDATHGTWVLTEQLQTWAVRGSGTYEVVSHHIGDQVVEGNLVMTGTGSMTSGMVTLVVQPMTWEIALTPMSSLRTDSCPA